MKTHAQILADASRKVARSYTTGQGGTTTNANEGNVMIPVVCAWCKTPGHTAQQGTKGICPPLDTRDRT
jgi:hypothetical protein